MQPIRTRAAPICSRSLAARGRDVNAADRAFAQRFAPRAEKLSRAPACATVELPCAFDEPGAIEQAAEVLFVQGEAGNGFDDALQMQQRELLRRQFEHDGAIFDLGA